VIEEGSDLATELWETQYPAASSILSYPEGRAALAAARRAGRLTARSHKQALADFEDLQSELGVVGIDETLAREAGELAEDLRLGGYDAVHLASAIGFGADATLITWDGDLRDAARALGCAVAPAPARLE